MQIIGDTCADFVPERLVGLKNLTLVPLTFTLDGKVYRSGVEIDSDGFYKLITATTSYPTTSQPSVGDFAEAYRRVAQDDKDMLSIHVSSALSGTFNSAQAAAQLTSDGNVTVYDSKLISAPLAWMLEAASRCVQAGWSKEQTMGLMEEVRRGSDFIFTVPSLKYLIHGGRISHLKGLIGTALGLKPLIGIDTDTGKLTQAGQARTLRAAYQSMITHMERRNTPGSSLRVQVLHGANPEGAAALRELVDQHFECHWLPTVALAPVLGAHTGPGCVGVFYGPQSVFDKIP